MKKKEAAHIIQKYVARLHRHANRMKKDFAEKTIHDFRLEYKKLRAFLRMVMLEVRHPETLKFDHRIKKIYSTAGKIRDRQLCIKRIRESRGRSCGSLNIIQSLKREIKKQSEKHIFLSKKEFEGLGGNTIDALPAIIPYRLPRVFVNQKLSAINAIIISGNYTDTELHTIRKSIKDIMYAAAIVKNDSGARLPPLGWSQTDFKNGEDLTDTLGSFNDTGIALSFLTPAEIRNAGTREGECLRRMRRLWLAQKRRIRKKALQQLSWLNTEVSR